MIFSEVANGFDPHHRAASGRPQKSAENRHRDRRSAAPPRRAPWYHSPNNAFTQSQRPGKTEGKAMKQPFPKYAFFNNELYVSVKTIEPVPTTGRDAAIVCRRASGNAAEAEERYVEQRLWLEAASAVNETARSRGLVTSQSPAHEKIALQRKARRPCARIPQERRRHRLRPRLRKRMEARGVPSRRERAYEVLPL